MTRGMARGTPPKGNKPPNRCNASNTTAKTTDHPNSVTSDNVSSQLSNNSNSDCKHVIKLLNQILQIWKTFMPIMRKSLMHWRKSSKCQK